ncbi:MAG: polysaccharide deacetylase family protein, partial [Ginsengibacter sp.]
STLIKKFPNLQFKTSKFDAIITYDVDVAYKFKGRNALRNAGSFLKDLFQAKIKNIISRNQTLQKKRDDPWDTYEYIEKVISKNNLPSIFFFLVGDNSKNDRNLSYKNPVMRSLVNKIKTFSEIGIHPSFKSSMFTKKILIEKKRLEEMYGKNITKSRQHFLKFRLPQTYNALIESGITEDYSMGFPYEPGFRAGTSKPFYFYDLLEEKSTTLRIFPITLMEGIFFTNGEQTHEKISEEISSLINEVKNVNGTFLSIWHNNTVSETDEFRNWRFIHDRMIEKIALHKGSTSA